jgi:hypothetical protein
MQIKSPIKDNMQLEITRTVVQVAEMMIVRSAATNTFGRCNSSELIASFCKSLPTCNHPSLKLPLPEKVPFVGGTGGRSVKSGDKVPLAWPLLHHYNLHLLYAYIRVSAPCPCSHTGTEYRYIVLIIGKRRPNGRPRLPPAPPTVLRLASM